MKGLSEYLKSHYENSIFTHAMASNEEWILHLHGLRIIQAKIVDVTTYDITIKINEKMPEILPKIQIKLIYPAISRDSVIPKIKYDQKTKALCLDPILQPARRHFVKNKSLYPLMMDRQVVFFILLGFTFKFTIGNGIQLPYLQN